MVPSNRTRGVTTLSNVAPDSSPNASLHIGRTGRTTRPGSSPMFLPLVHFGPIVIPGRRTLSWKIFPFVIASIAFLAGIANPFSDPAASVQSRIYYATGHVCQGGYTINSGHDAEASYDSARPDPRRTSDNRGIPARPRLQDMS